MRWLRILIISLTFTAGAFLTAKPIRASEGTAELRSTTGQNYRCFATSLHMPDQAYRVLVSCRDLLYPAGENIFSYIMWASPTGGGNPIKLGALGFGKAEFKTKNGFSSLLVTTEVNPKVKKPSGDIVMQGGVQPISFLERPTTPTPTPEGEVSEEEAEVPSEQLTAGQRLISALKRAGVVILLALVAVIGLVFVLTRPKT